MKRKLTLIMTVLLLLGSFNVPQAQAVLTLISTDGTTVLPEGNGSENVVLQFGLSLAKVFTFDRDAGPGSDGAYSLDDDLISTGNVDAASFTEGGSTTLNIDISGNAATADSAASADNATHASTADSAASADWATGATYADSADVATSAGSATTASDLTCTDCIGTTEIADSYLLNNGDSGTGTYSFDTVGIGTPTPDTLLHLYKSDTGNNDIVNLLKLERISASKAGPVEVGFGAGIDFYLENDVGTQVEAARIDVVWEDARETRELSSIRFNQSISSVLTETMRLDDAGRLGISNTSPQSLLDVQGPVGTGTASAGVLTLDTKELTVVDGDQLGRIDFNAPLESDGSDSILVGASIWAEADATFSATVNSTELVFATGTSEAATERMRIDRDGLVGIGSSTPAAKLSINGGLHVGGDTDPGDNNALIDGTLHVDGVQTSAGIVIDNGATVGQASGPLLNFDDTSNYLEFTGGNLGIGDTSPDALLNIQSSAAAHNGIIIENTNGGDYDPTISFQLTDGTTLFTMGVDDSASDAFKISTTGLGTNDRFTIGSNGSVAIGGPTTVSGDVKATSTYGFTYNNGTTVNNVVLVDPVAIKEDYTAGGDENWTDIDVTSQTSSAATGIFVCMWITDTGATGSAPAYLFLRRNGSGDADYPEQLQLFTADASSNASYWESMCGLLPVDSGQILEYKVDATGASTAQFVVNLYGYVEPTT